MKLMKNTSSSLTIIKYKNEITRGKREEIVYPNIGNPSTHGLDRQRRRRDKQVFSTWIF